MATISDYLNKLKDLKSQLVDTLINMGVVADENEKLNTLVPKVLECKTEQNVEWGENIAESMTDCYILSQSVKELRLPYGIKTFGKEKVTFSTDYVLFYWVSSLEKLVFSDSVEIINPFIGTSQILNTVVIPTSVSKINNDAFTSCVALTDVYYTGTESEWNNITIGSGNTNLTNATIHYNYVPE